MVDNYFFSQVNWKSFVANASGKDYILAEDWLDFYRFCLFFSNVDDDHRPSISDVIHEAKAAKIPNPGSIGAAFGHCIWILALHKKEGNHHGE